MKFDDTGWAVIFNVVVVALGFLVGAEALGQ